MRKPNLSGLYVITDHALLGNTLVEQAGAAIEGGTRILQYRDKTNDISRRLNESHALASLCKQHHIIFLINDDIKLAQEVDADGVHLGQQDTDLNSARSQLGADKIIGITCHSDLGAALQAEKNGADYVAFGRFFPSNTKPNALSASLNILTQAKVQLQIPVVAIGGITPDNGQQLIEAGADMLAVIHGIFGTAETKQAAQKFMRLFG